MSQTGGGFFVNLNDVWFIRGVLSKSFVSGFKRCDFSGPAIYTKVSDYLDWINQEFKEE